MLPPTPPHPQQWERQQAAAGQAGQANSGQVLSCRWWRGRLPWLPKSASCSCSQQRRGLLLVLVLWWRHMWMRWRILQWMMHSLSSPQQAPPSARRQAAPASGSRCSRSCSSRGRSSSGAASSPLRSSSSSLGSGGARCQILQSSRECCFSQSRRGRRQRRPCLFSRQWSGTRTCSVLRPPPCLREPAVLRTRRQRRQLQPLPSSGSASRAPPLARRSLLPLSPCA